MATYPRLAQAYATTGGATLYTGPAGGAIIRQIRVCSVGSSDSFHMAHGADYDDNCVVPWTVVGSSELWEDDVFMGVENGDTILLQSDGFDNILVVTLYGVLL